MKITHYSFGRITVDGNTYTSDLIIFPDRVEPSWWRKKGHNLSPEDLTDMVNAEPDELIIGTGYSGAMAVSREALRLLKSRGIEVRVQNTGRAVEIFNSAPGDKKVIAALHLTC